jgi:hypothetical protein
VKTLFNNVLLTLLSVKKKGAFTGEQYHQNWLTVVESEKKVIKDDFEYKTSKVCDSRVTGRR